VKSRRGKPGRLFCGHSFEKPGDVTGLNKLKKDLEIKDKRRKFDDKCQFVL